MTYHILSETFVNSSIENDDYRLKIDGYNLVSQTIQVALKNGESVFILKNIFLSLEGMIYVLLSNWLVTEIIETCFLTCFYRSPTQDQDEFEYFCTNLNSLLVNINEELPVFSIVIRDFNARCFRWWSSNITNVIVSEIDNLTSSAGYKQIID